MSSASCSQPDGRDSATIAVATNFKTTLETLEADFETRSGYELELVSGSTGKLYAQIINGAPYDVYLAADQARPERLVRDGRADSISRFTYAFGGIALWSSTLTDVSPDTLWDADFNRLALANPELAPYGQASVELIDHYELTETLEPKLVFGESVGQAFAFVSTGNADLGFVSIAQVLALPEEARGSAWLIPRQFYAPIAQDAVLLNHGKDNRAAQAFLTYLKSDAARQIIRRSGYWNDELS
ncbi:MAG: molybdate ABC transporter substrate-binding protein [Pseudomonadota bacterium]